MALRPVSAAEIESLAIGAWILGTGGGGSPYLALLNMRKLYREGAVVSLLDPQDLADDDPVAVVSNMGAPLVGQDRLTLIDVRDNAVIVARAASWKWMERLSRRACVEVGSIAATCKAPRTGKEVKECAILGSTSKAIRLGQTVQSARRAHRDPIAALIDAEGGRLIFTGKIADVARRATEGFLRGTAR